MLKIGQIIKVRPHPYFSDWFDSEIVSIGIETTVKYIAFGVFNDFHFYTDGYEKDDQVKALTDFDRECEFEIRERKLMDRKDQEAEYESRA